MLGSLYSGVTGINAAGYTMSVVGNNIANSSTIGFKAGYTSFADILSQALGGAAGGSQIGRGVAMTDVGTVFSQGSFENTTNGTDLAIEGSGFFIVADGTGSYYTRAGSFIMDEEGKLVNPSGYELQGYMIVDGVAGTTLESINVGQVSSAPNQTGLFRIAANLDATTMTDGTYSTTITVYDSLGSAIPLTITFTKTATDRRWTYDVSIPANLGSVAGGSGTIEFDTDGTLLSVDGTTVFDDVTFELGTLTSGAAVFTISWDLWDSDDTAPTDELTQYSDTSDTNFLWQDGYAPGSIQTISVDQDGKIIGLFTNGQTRDLAQVILADFISPWGLSKMGRSLYAESADSGQATMGTPGTGGRGRVSASSLEMSNVDMASEFVKMITTQRAYQANARVITTSDQLLSELMQIKR